jgi:hypothetical protein
MPWALPAALRQTVLEVARGEYAGFKDSHRCQKLHCEEHLVQGKSEVEVKADIAKSLSPSARCRGQNRLATTRRRRPDDEKAPLYTLGEEF